MRGASCGWFSVDLGSAGWEGGVGKVIGAGASMGAGFSAAGGGGAGCSATFLVTAFFAATFFAAFLAGVFFAATFFVAVLRAGFSGFSERSAGGISKRSSVVFLLIRESFGEIGLGWFLLGASRGACCGWQWVG